MESIEEKIAYYKQLVRPAIYMMKKDLISVVESSFESSVEKIMDIFIEEFIENHSLKLPDEAKSNKE